MIKRSPRKSITAMMEEAHAEGGHFNRVLGPVHLTLLGIGVMIGAGIFVLPGQVAAQYTGPAIILSFIVSAIACAFAGLCYAEFSSMLPVSGSAYTYAYATLGEFVAWIIGWDLILEYIFGAATVASGWSGYLASFLGDFKIYLPAALSGAPFAHDAVSGFYRTGAIINLPAVFIVFLMSALLVVGIKQTAGFNNVIVFIKVAVILTFIGAGFFFVNAKNWTPLVPPNTGSFGHFGWSGVLRGAGVIFFAYLGFDAISTAAQEVKNPKRTMPIGILCSLAVTTVLYILVGLVLTGLVHYGKLGVPDPIAVGVNEAGPALFWLRPFIKLGAIAGLSSVVLVLLMGQPRIFYSMARDGLLPESFARVHSRFRTPYITTMITGCAAAILTGLFPVGLLGEMVSIGTLLAFVIVALGVLVLRYTRPDLPRTFKTPLVPYIPVLGVLIFLAEMWALPYETKMRLVIWMAIGLVIYFSYSRHHSVEFHRSK